MPEAMKQPSGNYICNDRGGITYMPNAMFADHEGRSSLLADVRALADATHDLCAAHHNFWPRPYPIPEDVHCALMAANYGLERVRSGTLRRLAEQDAHPPAAPHGTYSISLADLIHIADAATELDGLRAFLVDQPGEQHRVANRAQHLRDLIQRAAGQHTHAIFGKRKA